MSPTSVTVGVAGDVVVVGVDDAGCHRHTVGECSGVCCDTCDTCDCSSDSGSNSDCDSGRDERSDFVIHHVTSPAMCGLDLRKWMGRGGGGGVSGKGGGNGGADGCNGRLHLCSNRNSEIANLPVLRKIARVRQPWRLKLNRSRTKLLIKRWDSVPINLPQDNTPRATMAHSDRRSSDSIVEKHDQISEESYSCTTASITSLESTKTFRYFNAQSYENLLRKFQNNKTSRRVKNLSMKKRSNSETTIDCGEEVVSKLQLLKNRISANRTKSAEPDNHTICMCDLNIATCNKCNNHRQTLPARKAHLSILPEERHGTVSRFYDAQKLHDQSASKQTSAAVATADELEASDDAKPIAPLSLPMSAAAATSSVPDTDTRTLLAVSSHLPNPGEPCRRPVIPPRRSRRRSRPVTTDSQNSHDGQPSTSKCVKSHSSFDLYRPGGVNGSAHDRAESVWQDDSHSECSSVTDGHTTTAGQRPAPPPRHQSRKRSAEVASSKFSLTECNNKAIDEECEVSCVHDVDHEFFENFSQLTERQRRLQQATSLDCETQRRCRPRADRSQDRGQRPAALVSSALSAVVPLAASASRPLTTPARSIASFVVITGKEVGEVLVSALYALQHPLGCDAPTADETEAARQLLRRTFQLTEEQFSSYQSRAEAMDPPSRFLECTVIGANDLIDADSNGLSDPYCVLKLNNSQCRETSVCYKTLNPVWNQKYLLPISDPETDELQFDVLDFDEDENFGQKMKKISEIKGLKGFGRLVKNITKLKRHSFLGQVKIKVKNIPALGSEKFFKLQARRRESCATSRALAAKERGRLRLALKLLVQSRPSHDLTVLMERHGKLLVSIMTMERRLGGTSAAAAAAQDPSPVDESDDNYTWSVDQMSESSKKMIDQHSAHCNLDQALMALVRWIAYVQVHCNAPMSYTFLYNALQTVRAFLQSRALSQQNKELLIASLLQFTDHCYETLRIHRHLFNPYVPSSMQNMESMLRCLLIISEIFPMLYEKLLNQQDGDPRQVTKSPAMEKLSNPKRFVHSSLVHSNEDWYRQVYRSARKEAGEDDNDKDSRCRSLILLINMLYADVEGAPVTYGKIFNRNLDISYFNITYNHFAEKLQNEVGPIVEELSRRLPCVKFDANNKMTIDTRSQKGLNMGTALFELYMALQTFTSLSDHLTAEDGTANAQSQLRNFHEWFTDAVDKWLNIACYKALQRIKKAIELDQVTDIDPNINHSSSAIDTVAVFYQIRTFWKQLSWPDAIGSYSFITKILDDIIRCADFYVRQMHASLREKHFLCHGNPFNLSQQLCLAINSVEFVKEQIPRLPTDLGFEAIFTAMEDQMHQQSTVTCRATLQNIIDQASEDIEQVINELIDDVVNQMMPVIREELYQLRVSGAQEVCVERLTDYLETNLATVNTLLGYANFRQLLHSLWRHLLEAFETEAHQHKTRSCEYFVYLTDLVKITVEIVHADGNGLDETLVHCDNYSRLSQWLHLYSSRVDKLIALYYNRKFQLQQDADRAGKGKLGVMAYFMENILHIEILNGRELCFADIDSCNPYVKLTLQPEGVCPKVRGKKTKVHSKTIYPLFGETFEFLVDRQLLIEKECSLVFVVKNSFKLRQSDVIGEAVFPVSEMATLTFDQKKQATQHILNILPVTLIPELRDTFNVISDKSATSGAALKFVKALSSRNVSRHRTVGEAAASVLPRLSFPQLTSTSLTLQRKMLQLSEHSN